MCTCKMKQGSRAGKDKDDKEDRHMTYAFGQIIATSHDLNPKGSWGREIPFYFREIEVGETL